MCQAISEGGRRCPVHRRDTVAVIYSLKQGSNLPQDVMEGLFTELQREARHLAPNAGLTDNYETLIRSTEVTLRDTEEASRYQEILAERDSDSAPTPETMYALTRLGAAMQSRATALTDNLSAIADERGISVDEARAQWESLRRDVKAGRLEVNEDNWNEDIQEASFEIDLPSDKLSVVAFAYLREATEQGPRRIQEHTDLSDRHDALLSGGYDPDGGRMEIRFASNPDTTYAYHDVPEEIWEQISETSRNPMSVFARQVRNNSEYAYRSVEEGEADAHTVRCESCGQYRAAAHSCPERDIRTDALNAGAVANEIPSLVHTVQDLADDDFEHDERTTSLEEAVNELRREREAQERELAEQASYEEEPLADWERELLDGVGSDYESGLQTVEEYVASAEEDRRTVEEYRRESAEDVDENGLRAWERELLDGVENETVHPNVEEPVDNFTRPSIPENATDELIENYDSQDDAMREAMPRLREMTASDYEHDVQEIDGGPTQSTEIQHRMAERIVRAETRGRTESSLGRYGSEGVMYNTNGVEGVPEEVLNAPRSERQRTNMIVSRDFSDVNGYNHYATRRFLLAYDSEQFYNVPPRRFNSNMGVDLRHTPVRPSPYRVEEEYGAPTPEERQRVENEYRATADGQLNREEVRRNLTANRSHTPSMTMTVGSQENVNVFAEHTVAWAGVRDVRRILAEDGATIAAPIEYTVVSPQRMVRDEHGNVLRPREGTATVTGTLAVTREGDNLRTTSGRHELQCDCPSYRRNYHCRHVDFVRDNGYRVARSMMAPSERSSSGATGGVFQAALMNRREFSHRTEEDGTLVGTFNSSHASRRSMGYHSFSTLATVDEYSGTSVSLEQTRRAIRDTNSSLYLVRPNVVQQALRRADRVDVVLPNYQNSVGSDTVLRAGGYHRSTAHITGTLGLTNGDEGKVNVSTERLRCSCGRFQAARDAGGECPHIQRYAEVTGRYYSRDGAHEFATNYRVSEVAEDPEHTEELRIQGLMDTMREADMNGGFATRTDEELRAIASDRVAYEREQADRIRREQEEQRRLANASFVEYAASTEAAVRAERQRFLDRDPEFARELEGYRAARTSLWENTEEGYGDNIEAIQADFREALEKRENNDNTRLEPLTENVTDGICDPNVPGHRKFGVELEFDLPRGANVDAVKQAIINDLRAEGLTRQTAPRGWHHAARALDGQPAWSDWSLEHDATVAGELVSPILTDSPEDWEKMGKALDILKRHGAIVTQKVGSHIHISSGSYLNSLAKHSELMATVQEHEQVIYRSAANPAQRSHRGGRYCTPNVEAPSVPIGADQRGGRHSDPTIHRMSEHTNMLNFQASSDMSKKEHVEFRMWDGSLDLATIQQQVATSAALADYADRKVEADGQYAGSRGRSNLPVNVGSSEATEDELKNVAGLVDKIFRRQSDRKRFVAMFAANKWS